MKNPKPQQVRWTIPTGTGEQGRQALHFWKEAARRTLQDPKLFNAWIRSVLNAEAARVLRKKK